MLQDLCASDWTAVATAVMSPQRLLYEALAAAHRHVFNDSVPANSKVWPQAIRPQITD
jgi:hypothetical protein